MVGQLGVSGEMLDRAADAITKQLDGGYRTHWCAEWENEAGRCARCLEIAEAALKAALEAK